MLALLSITVPAAAQLGKLKGIADKAAKTYDDFNFTDEEEQQLGSEISAKLRERYGVVQDRAVHKYVTLIGSVLAGASTRPDLRWTFVVLDTDGVNAFAAPGGFVHITRGALALIQSEGELADVLAHEIGHITLKHTIKAIQKAKGADMAASASRQAFIQAAANKGYEVLLENKFDRDEEGQADRIGLTLANKSGYSPAALSAFLTKLADRNKDLKERSGVFASHPETMSRIDDMKKLINAEKLTRHRDGGGALYVHGHVQAGAGRQNRAGRAASPAGEEGRGAEIERRREVRHDRPQRARQVEVERQHHRVGRIARSQSRSRCPGRAEQGTRRRHRQRRRDRGVPERHLRLSSCRPSTLSPISGWPSGWSWPRSP